MSATPYEQVRARAEDMGLRPIDKSQGFACDCPLDHKNPDRHLFVYRKKGGGARLKCYRVEHTEEDLAAALGFTIEGLRPPKPSTGGVTLEQYADLKKLPVAFLSELGLRTVPYLRDAAVSIPHLNEHNVHESTCYRIHLSPRVMRWKKNDRAIPYGLWRLADGRAAGRTTVVEGPSDCHVLWYRGEPALGLAGAGGWNTCVESACDGVGTVYVVIEPGQGGAELLKKVSTSRLRDRIRIVRLPVKDPADLHVKDPDGFPAAWKVALERAPRLVDELDQEKAAQTKVARARCADLLRSTDILGEFEKDLAKLVAGEAGTGKLVFLALVSRRFPRPVSVSVRGASSTGKSHVTQATIRFVPEACYFAVTAMSERALIFSEEDFRHRFVVIFEAGGLGGDMQQYFLRSLLSEGRLRYPITEKDPSGKHVTRMVEKEGPTGLLFTTTRTSVNQENETRLLNISADDTKGQTARVMEHIAESDGETVPMDFARWHALQEVIDSTDARVVIPYVKALARRIEPVSVRLRRDFSVIMSLVKAHALLHQESRKRDTKGWIIATLRDYGAVRELVGDRISEAVGASVPVTVRETVAAVEKLAGENGCSVTAVAKELNLDKGPTSYRVRKAIEAGYIVNMNAGKKGVAYQLKPGAALPSDENILPTPEELEVKAEEVRRIFEADEGPCSSCGGSNFYVNGSAPPVCGGCHPPAKPETVRWISPAGEGVAADAH